MVGITNRITRAWDRHGVLGFICLIPKNIAYFPRAALRKLAGKTVDRSFDLAHGTETSGIREVGSLDIDSPNARHAVRYQPSPEAQVRNAIESLSIDPARFTFIDFGSGKGRALMIAAEYPFKQVIGVEFSSELNEIARRNIAQLPAPLNAEGRIVIVSGDAAEFDLPFGDLVCYFFNPFGASVFKPIVAQLIENAASGGYAMVIYGDPRHREIFESTGAFALLHSSPSMLVMETRRAGIEHGRTLSGLEVRCD